MRILRCISEITKYIYIYMIRNDEICLKIGVALIDNEKESLRWFGHM